MIAQAGRRCCGSAAALRGDPRGELHAAAALRRRSSLIAAAASFEGPARAALLPTLVPRELFPRAVIAALHGADPRLGERARWSCGFIIAELGVAAGLCGCTAC